MARDGALVIRGDVHRIPLRPGSVDLIVTSPPYYSQRSYKDGDEHYPGQIGDEPSPQEWLAELWEATSSWWDVLAPTGSAFINLGDKRAGSGAPGTTSGLTGANGSTPRSLVRGGAGARPVQGERSGMTHGYHREQYGRDKAKQMLPHRYAIGCEDGAADPDGIGWLVRQDLVWWKKNGMPESVRDRHRDQHEYVFHLTKQGAYYSAIDELREPSQSDRAPERMAKHVENEDSDHQQVISSGEPSHPLGAAPGSVMHLPTEPLVIPDWLGVDHFAAFPTELPRRLILGFSPPAICLECGEGRRPVTTVEHELDREALTTGRQRKTDLGDATGNGWNGEGYAKTSMRATILGYSCACTPYTDHPERRAGDRNHERDTRGNGTAGGRKEEAERLARLASVGPVREFHLDGWTPPPSRPAVVLDPFGGTGTTAMVARTLGRVGVSLDLSWDYSRVARWRIWESGHGAKIAGRTNRERQGSLL